MIKALVVVTSLTKIYLSSKGLYFGKISLIVMPFENVKFYKVKVFSYRVDGCYSVVFPT
jgi:hypothetical protein